MTTNPLSVAVLVLNWNGEAILPTFLPSWLEHTPHGVELIIVDNGSTDGSLIYLREHYPEVRILDLGTNYGFAEGYNRAIASLDHEIVVLLNSDVALAADWLTEPLELLRSDKRIAAVQPKIRSYQEPNRFEYAGAAGGYIDWLGYPFCRGRLFDVIEEDRGQYDTPAELFWASGACFIVRREVYQEVGGLDARFFAHQEEIDLSWRILSLGYRIVFAPSSVVYHLGGGSLAMNNPRKTYLNFRNNLLMLYKNLPCRSLIVVQALRLVLDIVAALQYLLRGLPRHAWAVLRAYRDYCRMIPQMRSSRSECLSAAIAPLLTMKPYSVLWLYFLRGKKTYAELD